MRGMLRDAGTIRVFDVFMYASVFEIEVRQWKSGSGCTSVTDTERLGAPSNLHMQPNNNSFSNHLPSISSRAFQFITAYSPTPTIYPIPSLLIIMLSFKLLVAALMAGFVMAENTTSSSGSGSSSPDNTIFNVDQVDQTTRSKHLYGSIASDIHTNACAQLNGAVTKRQIAPSCVAGECQQHPR